MLCPARASFRHARLPVSQIGREVVHRKAAALFVGPVVGTGQSMLEYAGVPFGKGGPLRISHHPPAGVFFNPGKLAAHDHGRRRRSRVASLGRHDVGEIEASSAHPDQSLAGFQFGIWKFFERRELQVRTSSDRTNAFIAEILAG